MPQQYVGQGEYRVSCNDCGLGIRVHGIPTVASTVESYAPGNRDDQRALLRGRPVTDYFTWDRSGERFYSLCKRCKTDRIRRRREEWAAAEAGREAAPIATTPNLGRRYGVELEVLSPLSHVALQATLRDAGLDRWRVKYDGSLPGGGAEIVSPVLQGDDGLDQIRRACRVLRSQGCTVSRACGMHVHHEIRDMTVNQVKGLARMWADNQDVIDGLVAPSRRGGRNSYCGRLDDSDLANLDRCDRLERIDRYVRTRYKTLNLASYGRYGTVEIRQHQGTLDAEKVISWLQLGQAMIEQARSQTAFRATTVRQFIGGLDQLDETAGTFLLGRAVRFNAAAL